jgi:hypothetical protein
MTYYSLYSLMEERTHQALTEISLSIVNYKETIRLMMQKSDA